MKGPLRIVSASALAMATALCPLAAEAASGPEGAWLLDAGASVGFFTAGGLIAARYRFPLGLTLGLEADPVAEISTDAVEGLSGGRVLFLSAYATAGWDFRLGRRFFAGTSLLMGAEAAFLSERVVDPAHAIDRSYRTVDLMFDPACRVAASWYPTERFGLGLSILVSLYDLRKSLAGLVASMRCAPMR